jgi:hypothetical protein
MFIASSGMDDSSSDDDGYGDEDDQAAPKQIVFKASLTP